MNYLRNVAIVGAAGRLGGFLTQDLVNCGRFKVTAIRRPDSRENALDRDVAIVTVDYNDRNALIDALRNQDVLVITLNFFAPPQSQEQLVDAAVEAGVKYILPNEWAFAGADAKLGEDIGMGPHTIAARQYIESAIAGKDIYWISMTCGPWFEFSLVCGFDCASSARFGFDFDTRTVTFFDNNGINKVHTTTWHQVARCLTALLSLPIKPEPRYSGPTLTQFNNSSVHVASFLVSQHDMFESVLRVRGERKSDWTLRQEETQARFNRATHMIGNDDKMIHLEGMVTRMYTRFFWPDGSAIYTDRLVNGILGLPEERLDEATTYALKLREQDSPKLQL